MEDLRAQLEIATLRADRSAVLLERAKAMPGCVVKILAAQVTQSVDQRRGILKKLWRAAQVYSMPVMPAHHVSGAHTGCAASGEHSLAALRAGSASPAHS